MQRSKRLRQLTFYVTVTHMVSVPFARLLNILGRVHFHERLSAGAALARHSHVNAVFTI